MKALFLAVLMAGASTAALAADLPTRKEPPAPAPIYAPPFTWTGLYLGINGGFGVAHIGNTDFGNPNGGEIGGTIGYNWQMGQVVFGGEADLDWASETSGHTFVNGSTNFKVNAITTERLRLGYAVDHALFYITGGYAGVSTQASISDNFGFTGQPGSLAQRRRDRRRHRICVHQQHHRQGRISLGAVAEQVLLDRDAVRRERHHVGFALPRGPELQVLICHRVERVEKAGGFRRLFLFGSAAHAALGR